ncbi:MAG: sodium/glutamate symporter [Candidatus Theseobacter exili]|nr:sodium/glutamate symporter [Candidatus Theseobacter exili]
MTVIISFCSLCVVLIAGVFLRLKVSLFRRYFIPASVIGGILGLIIIQLPGDFVPYSCIAGWNKLPGILINIVFASLFLGVRLPSIKKIWGIAGPQVVYGQMVAWGQYAVGLGLSIVIALFFVKIPAFFGAVVPVGFEGGHGTAAGLQETFQILGWPDGGDIALASATAGIVFAVIIGTILINWAVRRGYTEVLEPGVMAENNNKNDIFMPEKRPAAGFQTISSASLDSLGLHLAMIGIAVFIGFIFHRLIIHFIPSFPLFPLCMIGGMILQIFLNRFSGSLIDHNIMQRIGGTALDFLVVAAIATIRLPVVAAYLLPFVVVVAGGIAWNVFCVVYLARRLLPDAWFERAIVEMGQSMGVTATGMLLLRVVDPEAKTPAYSAFGYKQLLHEPFMGGGLWTSLAIPLAITYGAWVVFIISLAAIGFWLIVWKKLFYKAVSR